MALRMGYGGRLVTTGLFQLGDFTLASGSKSGWKIECDDISLEEWNAIALMMSEILDPFTTVYGVPRGGLPLSDALKKYRNTSRASRILIVDDVWTTGGSMDKFIRKMYKDHDTGNLQRAVVFARNPTPPNVKVLFQMGL